MQRVNVVTRIDNPRDTIPVGWYLYDVKDAVHTLCGPYATEGGAYRAAYYRGEFSAGYEAAFIVRPDRPLYVSEATARLIRDAPEDVFGKGARVIRRRSSAQPHPSWRVEFQVWKRALPDLASYPDFLDRHWQNVRQALQRAGWLAQQNPRREHIPGGLAAGRRPADFDRAALARGTAVELEHTNDPKVAQEIAMDHLVEDPRYYEKLAQLGPQYHIDAYWQGHEEGSQHEGDDEYIPEGFGYERENPSGADGEPHGWNPPGEDDWPVVAYRERESFDPLTGAPGVLRTEWRVNTVKNFSEEVLVAAWGPDWRRHRPFAEYVLEQRYIRRGHEEPWTLFEAANDYTSALQSIPDEATALDGVLRELQAVRRDAAEERRVKFERESQERRAREDAAELRKRSQVAFVKLEASPRDGHWARRWNAWIARYINDVEYVAALARDTKSKRLYDAVMDAVTVPSKRAAIKKFLAWHAPDFLP